MGTKIMKSVPKPYSKGKLSYFKAALLIIILSFSSACFQMHGGIRLIHSPYRPTIDDLVAGNEEHNIWTAGEGAYLTAILFDPKGDNRRVVTHEWWMQLEERKELPGLVSFLKSDYVWPPSLYELTGPDGALFGYIYSVESMVTLDMIGKDTLRVGNILPAKRDIIDDNF